MLQNIQQLTSAFLPISLSEMEKVSLLDRMDSKFYFRTEKLEEVFSFMIPHYRLLEVNGINFQRYESLYFDTQNFSLYTKHQNGIQNRYKIRFRNYLDSQLCFFEIKHKNNKGRTVKHRLRTNELQISEEAEKFLLEKTSLAMNQLQNKLTVSYSRLTFVNMNSCERVTLDLVLCCKKGNRKIEFNELVIAEVKQDKSSLASPFIKIARQQKIREGGISKYCLSVASLYPEIKKNLFKEQINSLKKLIA